MNLGALPELLLGWIRTQGASLLQVGKAEPVSPFQPGQEYQGTVLDQLPSGRHLVKVAGQQLDMNLPASTRPGESVRLTFLNAGPRPTFLLNAPSAAPIQDVRLSNAAQQVGALLRMHTTAAPVAQAAPVAMAATSAVTGKASPLMAPPARPTSAASPAQVAQGLVQAAGPGAAVIASRPIAPSVTMLQAPVATPGMPAPVASASTGLMGEAVGGLRAAVPASMTLSAAPVAELPAPSPGMLPARLAQTVRESGLFYEAHVLKWAKGEWPREALLREPQADFGHAGRAAAVMSELSGMSEEVARMAGRQLHLLEGGAFVWQGQAWPGQWMQWQVEERAAGQEGGEAEGREAWVSEIRMTLPGLGGVNARVALSGQRVSLNLSAVEPQALDRLQAALPELVRALGDAGLEPGRMTLEVAHG